VSADPSGAGRRVWAVLELLDRQLVDRNGRLVGKVDDVEFEIDDDPGALPRVSAVLSGLGALANHIGGDAGRALAATERRLAAARDRQPSRIDIALVQEIGSAVELDAVRDDIDTNRAERWTRDVIIGKIPGAGHVAE
jgi:sporulation protein YlmC with PRC-barrel domain